MFVARGVAYMVNGNRNTNAIASGIGQEMGDRFQNFFYYGDHRWPVQHLLDRHDPLCGLLLPAEQDPHGPAHLCHRLQRGRGQLSGVSVVATVTKAYLVSAFCSFVVGLILCAQASMGNMEAGNTYEMYGGGRRRHRRHLPGRHGPSAGHPGGAAVWQTLENGLNMIGAQVGIQRIVIGVIVVFAVLLDVVFRRGIFSRKTTKRRRMNCLRAFRNRNKEVPLL